jgi:hypothetical protein
MLKVRNIWIAGLLAISAPVAAQLPPGLQGLSADYMPLIFINPRVAADMHLSPAVAQKEQTLFFQQGMALLPMFMNQSGGKAGNKSEMMGKVLAAFKKMQESSLAPLSPAQRVRYRQLTLQFEGPAALVEPKVAHSLGLSEGQKSQLASAFYASSHEMQKKFQTMKVSTGGNAMSNLTSIQDVQAKSRIANEKRAKAILTSSQWSKWTALQGKKLPGIEKLF